MTAEPARTEKSQSGIASPLTKILLKLSRFSVVGVISGVLYAAFTAAGVSALNLDAKIASLVAYALVIPFNFTANRSFTFGSSGQAKSDLLRYGVVQGVNALVCFLLMGAAVDKFGLHYGFGVAFGVLFVPFVTYIVMDLWVFRDQSIR